MNLIDFRKAQQLVQSKARSFGQETVALEDADGRFLAEDIRADRDYPPFNRSAMDGYALRLEDWKSGHKSFQIQDVIFAGGSSKTALVPGACFKIMTGAPVPPEANVVIRREDALEKNGAVEFTVQEIKPFQNIAPQGEDLKKDSIALPQGIYCSPAVISTLAALGESQVKVMKLPDVAFFTTGDEIKDISEPVNEHQIRNSNEWLIKSLLRRWHIRPSLTEHLADNKDQLEQAIRKALKHDVIILCGGVSAGDADYVPQILENLGVKELFHKVAIKPGKPIFCGETPEGGIVFALPGNPFSSLVTFKLFVEVFLKASLSPFPLRGIFLPFAGSRKKKTRLDEFFPVKLTEDGKGLCNIHINGSGDIRLGIQAEGIAHHPKESDELLPGSIIEFFY